MNALHLKIFGQVQGVFFRAFVQEVAECQGLTGWVKNCDDNSVELFAEGERAGLDELHRLCRTGPRGAKVTHCEVTYEEHPKRRHKQFLILHDEH